MRWCIRFCRSFISRSLVGRKIWRSLGRICRFCASSCKGFRRVFCSLWSYRIKINSKNAHFIRIFRGFWRRLGRRYRGYGSIFLVVFSRRKRRVVWRVMWYFCRVYKIYLVWSRRILFLCRIKTVRCTIFRSISLLRLRMWSIWRIWLYLIGISGILLRNRLGSSNLGSSSRVIRRIAKVSSSIRLRRRCWRIFTSLFR